MIQRPLTGEPLSLDLVNTQWVERGDTRDLFDEPGGVLAWLTEHGFAAPPADVESGLRQARTALRAVLERPGGESEAALNAVLALGSVGHRLREGLRRDVHVIADDSLPAWRCAVDYLDLMSSRPERIRRCAHPACVLYFYDTSRNGTRRWCSMDGCGSRTKAARHYERSRQATT